MVCLSQINSFIFLWGGAEAKIFHMPITGGFSHKSHSVLLVNVYSFLPSFYVNLLCISKVFCIIGMVQFY